MPVARDVTDFGEPVPDFEIGGQNQVDKPQLRRQLLQRRRERVRDQETERDALAKFALELVERFQARTIATYEPLPSEPDIFGLLSQMGEGHMGECHIHTDECSPNQESSLSARTIESTENKPSPFTGSPVGNSAVKPTKIRGEGIEFLIPHVERIGGKLAAPQWKSTRNLATVLPMEELQRADLVFIPALAVDESGTRLGRGGGWYDRALQVFRETLPEVKQSPALQVAASRAVSGTLADTEPAFTGGVVAKSRQLTRVPVIAVVFADEVFPAGFLPRESHDFPVQGVLTEAGYREFC